MFSIAKAAWALLLAAILLCGLYVGCGAKEAPTLADDEQILIIGPNQVRCMGAFEQDCFLVYEEAAGEWNLFYEGIIGFEYRPGFRYTLRVRLEERDKDIQDVGRYAYHLVEILEKKRAADVEVGP